LIRIKDDGRSGAMIENNCYLDVKPVRFAVSERLLPVC